MEEEKFSIQLPLEAIDKLEVLELPASIEKLCNQFEEKANIKDSEIYNKFLERQKYIGLNIVIGSIINIMIINDLPFMQCYDILKGRLVELLDEVDSVISEVYTDETLSTITEQLFSGIITIKDKMEEEGKDNSVIANTVTANVMFKRGQLSELWQKYGLDNVIDELTNDARVSQKVEQHYFKPLEDILRESLASFLEEEEMAVYFMQYFAETNKIIINQAMLDFVVNEVIKNGLNVSETLKAVDEETIFTRVKEIILSYIGLDGYQDELKATVKKILEA